MMEATQQSPTTSERSVIERIPEASPYQDRYLTIPNIICIVRMIGSVGLIGLALADMPTAFVIGFVVLSLSDWVDGKLARWLNQRSDFGARLDSASDAVLYFGLLCGSLILKGGVLRQELSWLLLPLVTYTFSVISALRKFGRFPSYHTRTAKLSHWLVLGAAVALLLEWSLWPMRVATVSVTIANLETVAITSLLAEWRADVGSLRIVLRDRRIKSGRASLTDRNGTGLA